MLENNSRVYIAGPMSNLPKFNFPAFDAAIGRVQERGYIPVPPADLRNPEVRKLALASPDGALGSASPNGETWADFLARDVKLVADEVDAVAVLEGWECSRGARLETYVARLCGKPVVWEDDFTPVDPIDLIVAWASVEV